jgi:hypothetical protein
MKSESLSILKIFISGIDIITLGFPPNSGIFASASPNDLEIYLIILFFIIWFFICKINFNNFFY